MKISANPTKGRDILMETFKAPAWHPEVARYLAATLVFVVLVVAVRVLF